MAKQILEEQYNEVVKYIQSILKERGKGYIDRGTVMLDIIDLPQICTYQSYLGSIPKKGKVKAKVLPEVESAFEKFWVEYPSTSKFEYNGKKFMGERVLKANKQVCLKLYSDILNSWTRKITESSESILKAMKVQVQTIKIESYKTGQNRMQYMSSIEVYLRQKKYEAWLGEEMPVDETVTKKVYQNSTDM